MGGRAPTSRLGVNRKGRGLKERFEGMDIAVELLQIKQTSFRLGKVFRSTQMQVGY